MNTKIPSKLLSLVVESTPDRLVNQYIGNPIPIFMLHRFSLQNKVESDSYVKHISWCLSYIQKHRYKPISLGQLAKSIKAGTPVEHKSVVFTVDDGFYDQYEIGSPLFSEFDVPLTCFVITDFLDGKLWPWDDQVAYIINKCKLKMFEIKLPNNKLYILNIEQNNNTREISKLRNVLKNLNQTSIYTWLDYFYCTAEVTKPSGAPREYRPMSWAESQKMIDYGHEIAPHTKSHRILSQINEHDARSEIEGACARVKAKLRGSSKLFAYPTGRENDYLERDISILKNNNIICAVNTSPSHFNEAGDLYSIPRFSLPTTRFDFIQYLSFFESLKNKIRR